MLGVRNCWRDKQRLHSATIIAYGIKYYTSHWLSPLRTVEHFALLIRLSAFENKTISA